MYCFLLLGEVDEQRYGKDDRIDPEMCPEAIDDSGQKGSWLEVDKEQHQEAVDCLAAAPGCHVDQDRIQTIEQ